jgi:hypothetical protein
MNRFKYRKIVAILALLVIVGWTLGEQAPAEAGQVIKILINGSEVPSDTSPEVISGRTYVPVRVISENLGAKVDWKQDTRQVVINWSTASTPSLPPAKSGVIQIIIDGEALNIPADYVKPYITNGRTMIPLRAIGEALGCEVNWIKESNTVDIKTKTFLLDNQLLKDLAQYQTNLKLMDGSVIASEKLLNMDASAFSSEQLEVFKTYRDQLAKYQQTVTLPTGVVISSRDLTITGDSYMNAQQLNNWIISETPRIKAKMTAQGLQFNPIPDLADLYIKIGAAYGIRGDIAFCQAAKETGFWQFTGEVQPSQNNYCGLYATGGALDGTESTNGADLTQVSLVPGSCGATFVTPAAGVEAHIQHLYAYATKNPLPLGKVRIDPRYSLVNRGIGPTWLKLNARWAVPGTTYGQSIIYDYWVKVVNTK